MSAHAARVSGSEQLLTLVVLNGATVSTLYWPQAVLGRISAEFGGGPLIALMPGAALAGYAVGVALLAAVGGDLTSPSALLRHLTLLVCALCLAAAAPNVTSAVLACGLIGVGCSLTQRLLACATEHAGPDARTRAIGYVVGGGLSGLVLARAVVPAACELFGWRAMFTASACLVALCGLRACGLCTRAAPPGRLQRRAVLPSAPLLWRSEPELRSAALQQAFVFAVFNMGWALFPRVLSADGIPSAGLAALVAGTGALAALLCGRVLAASCPRHVAQAAFAAAGAGGLSLLLGAWGVHGGAAGMILLEVGTQVALVANQARAQALAPNAATRGRITAIVTTVGFSGGALGAALGNCL